MAEVLRGMTEAVVLELQPSIQAKPYCKKCGAECQESRPFKCLACQAPSYWQCTLCEKELLLQSRGDHAKHCAQQQIQRKQEKTPANKKRSKRSAAEDASPFDSDSDSDYKKSKLSSDEEYTMSSESEDDCWSPELSPDSAFGRSSAGKKKAGSGKADGTAAGTVNYVAKVRALYSYTAARKDDLSFKEGDVVYVVNKRPSGWWLGDLQGKLGMIPSNYVSEIPFDPKTDPKPTNKASIDALIHHPPCRNESSTRSSLQNSNNGSSSKQGKGSSCKTIAEYDELVRLLKLELEQSQLKCRQQEDKIRAMEKEKADSVKELLYIKAVLENSLNYKHEEDAALEGLEALKSLHDLF